MFSDRAAASDEADLFRPSEYSAALIQALREAAPRVTGARVLEIGFGSGVILAAMVAFGAAKVVGVDLEPAAMRAGLALFREQHLGDRLELLAGDMFEPVQNRQFELVVANLPQFPTRHDGFDNRLRSWSDGGPDGRRYLDRFIAGVAAHLAPAGSAFITQNGCVGLDLSRRLAARYGLGLRIVRTELVILPDQKLDHMNPGILVAERGSSLHIIGHTLFADMYVVELAAHLPLA